MTAARAWGKVPGGGGTVNRDRVILGVQSRPRQTRTRSRLGRRGGVRGGDDWRRG
jgi:hypothetical protein